MLDILASCGGTGMFIEAQASFSPDITGHGKLLFLLADKIGLCIDFFIDLFVH